MVIYEQKLNVVDTNWHLIFILLAQISLFWPQNNNLCTQISTFVDKVHKVLAQSIILRGQIRIFWP